MEDRNYKHALQLLRTAHRLLVTEMKREPEQRATMSRVRRALVADDHRRTMEELSCDARRRHHPQQQHEQQSYLAQQRQRQRHYMDEQQQHEQEEEEETPFVYRRPIVADHLPRERCHYILSVIILFNMALSYHLLALEWTHHQSLPSLRSKLFREALKLYQLAIVMRNRGKLHFNTNFILAMVNNTVHIQRALGRPLRAQKLQDLMMSTLMMAVDNVQSSLIEELDGFMATASLSLRTTGMSPPKARTSTSTTNGTEDTTTGTSYASLFSTAPAA